MILETEDFKVTSDKYQFTLIAKVEIKEGRFTNPENIGKKRDEVLGYYPTFPALVRGAIKHKLESDTVSSLESINAQIESVAAQFKGVKR